MLFETTIAGSLPKPAWLAQPEILWAPWRLPPEALAEGQRDAVLAALAVQERAGIDIVSDGEQSRRHFVHGFLEHVDGVDFDRRVTIGIRADRYQAEVPTVVGPIARRRAAHDDGLPASIWNLCSSAISYATGTPPTSSRQRHVPAAFAGTTHRYTSLRGGPYRLPGTGTVVRSSGSQSPISKSWETTRVPGLSCSNRRGRSWRLTLGKRYIVTTVASPSSVTNRLLSRNSTRSATPCRSASRQAEAGQIL